MVRPFEGILPASVCCCSFKLYILSTSSFHVQCVFLSFECWTTPALFLEQLAAAVPSCCVLQCAGMCPCMSFLVYSSET